VRRESHDEFGLKNKVSVKIDGVPLDRAFRNKGEALTYLKKTEGLAKQDINRRVRFIFN